MRRAALAFLALWSVHSLSQDERLVPAMGALRIGDYAQAQYLLAIALESAPQGQRAAGAGRNFSEAHRLYRAAADQGHPEGLYNLALMYDMGVGVPRDEREMVRWLTLAANAGVPGAQAQLGLSYQRGLGVQRNLATAHEWLLKAAKAGHKGAMRELATVYEMGLGAPSDEAQARHWREQGK